MTARKSTPHRSSARTARPSEGRVRIIAGRWRSQRISVLDHEGLRPSSDRVRETLFNWLQHRWAGVFADKRVLDAFAGSGALGLECISRGASQVTFWELHPPALQGIQATLKNWQTQAPELVQAVQCVLCDATAQLAKPAKHPPSYDLIFLDPPFARDHLPAILPQLATHLQPKGLVYIEHEISAELTALLEQHLTHVRSGQTAQVQFGLWQLCA